MKQSFNLLKEFVTEYVNYWNKIQAKHDTYFKFEVDESVEDITLYDTKEPSHFNPIGDMIQGVIAMGWSYYFKWNITLERLELVIF